MSKKIIITGKRNIDSFKEKKEEKKRKESKKWENIKILSKDDNYNQIKILNKLYLNETYEGEKYVKQEINKKRTSYKNQDVKKSKYDINYFITYDEIIEKLVLSQLKCYYCRCECLLMYKNVREKKQWTLDRINNDIGHYKDNVVICCLECNLKKGTKNDSHYKFAKQMKIIKTF